jgi:hypothetical protein
MSTTETNDSIPTKLPSHIAYHVRDRGEGKKSFWTPIGSVWIHGDANGFSIQLDGLVPLDGRITCRIKSEKKA